MFLRFDEKIRINYLKVVDSRIIDSFFFIFFTHLVCNSFLFWTADVKLRVHMSFLVSIQLLVILIY